MDINRPILYNFYRSSSSWRVRLGLAWKGIEYEYRPMNLDKGDQANEVFLNQVNPTGKVPVLVLPNRTAIIQSTAILEYLEETYPEPAMLPRDPWQRAQVRELVQLIACDIQPLQNLGVLNFVGGDNLETRLAWANEWIIRGLVSLTKLLERSAGKYCVGDKITMADFFLVPMVGNARRHQVDLDQFDLIVRLDAALQDHPVFHRAHPDQQPDCPKHLD